MERKSSRGNPYHDEIGRFASADSYKTKSERSNAEYEERTRQRHNEFVQSGFFYETEIASADKEELDNIISRMRKDDRISDETYCRLFEKTVARERKLQRRHLLVWVDGVKDTKKFINWYVDENPEIKKEIPKYKDALKTVREFKDEGLYDISTQKKVSIDSGYLLTFHQNLSDSDAFGGYTDEEYAAMCAISAKELESKVYIRNYGYPEAAFICEDKARALFFAEKHNQESVYCYADDEFLTNTYYSKKTNPTRR